MKKENCLMFKLSIEIKNKYIHINCKMLRMIKGKSVHLKSSGADISLTFICLFVCGSLRQISFAFGAFAKVIHLYFRCSLARFFL